MATNNPVNTSLSGQTGTGKFVGDNTPAFAANISFPSGFGITDTSAGPFLQFTKIASAANWVQITNSITGNPPTIAAAGNDTNLALQISPKGTSGVLITGRTNATTVASGNVGEEIEAHLVFASSFGLSTATNHDVVSFALPAGDWDVWGNILFSAITVASTTELTSWISTTSVTLPDASLQYLWIGATAFGTSISQTPPSQRVNISSAGNLYLSVRAVFGAGSPIVCGNLYARRRS